jgi:hypothetical protein
MNIKEKTYILSDVAGAYMRATLLVLTTMLVGTILLVTIIGHFLLMVIITIFVDLKCLMKKEF